VSGMERRFTALVLAGSRGAADPVAAARGVAQKCLVPAGGVPMLCRVLDALAASRTVARILVTLQEPELLLSDPALAARRAARPIGLLAGAATPSLSVAAALAAIPEPYPLLVTTADHPLLTPEMIDAFAARAEALGADVAVGLTASRVLLGAYPESRRTWLRFRDERYSGANLFALMGSRGALAVAFWRRVEAERKRPWRIVRAFGLGSLLAYALGLLTLEEAMRRASARLGCVVGAICLPFPEAAIDVDKPDDLELVEAILARRAAA
jgi:GTP:adenosylcobinamide-phosphate guanylyltransferase